jgi:L-asparaginase II
MRAHPQLVGGKRSADTELMRACPGWIAKGGAEGLFCALSPDGTGWAFKVEDGSTRGLRPAVGNVLGVDAFRTVDVRNSLREIVGSVQ